MVPPEALSGGVPPDSAHAARIAAGLTHGSAGGRGIGDVLQGEGGGELPGGEGVAAPHRHLGTADHHAGVRGGNVPAEQGIAGLIGEGDGGVGLLTAHREQGGALGGGVASGGQIHISQGGVLTVLAVNAVLSAGDGEGAPADAHAVVGGQAVAGGGDGVGAAGHHQVILAHNAVAPGGLHGEGSGAVEGQVGAAKERGVHIVVVLLGVGAGVGQGVFTARGQGEEYLVRLPDVDGGVALTVEGHPVQHQLDFGGVRGVNEQRAVGEGAGEEVGALLGDGGGGAVHGDGIGSGGNGGAIKGDGGGEFGIGLSVAAAIVASHRGKIEAAAPNPQRLEMVVLLPMER